MLSNYKKLISLGLTAIVTSAMNAGEVAHFDMGITGGKITETISGVTSEINGVHAPEDVPGAFGKALRFDGYSTYIDASVGNILPEGSAKMTASVWLAIETYPIVELDVATTEQVAIASCLNETDKSGFGFFVGYDGQYSFKAYIGGWPLELKVNTPLPQYEWINLTAVIDTEAKTATLYNNGKSVASSKANGNITVTNTTMRIGRSFKERFVGPFCVTSFNGVIDDIIVWNEALSQSTIQSWIPENKANLSVATSRFSGDPMRPTFHGMPAANWTNETHGMIYYNNRYHVFFQKNANGPFMARLHWGHLSSENLYDWREEHIAITPNKSYDIKGCWSGCVFTDDALTGGKPSIIYTGVDYVKAVIAQASPADENLIAWNKNAMPIINGRPDGLSDDFRDPYFFRNGDNAYIIVGSSKGNVGTTTLHTYNPSTKTWSNDGKLFFTGNNAATCGTFWEMPNITKIGDKWIFTTTPQNTSKGVAALYWVGSINADGTFNPEKTTPGNIELPGFARDGYGLLSPTIARHDGKTIVIGIVPDKLPSQSNYDLGYAHTYSLPREWSIDNNGDLCQKPYSGLTDMRVNNGFAKADFTLDGSMDIEGVSGRTVELNAEFIVGTGKTGFTLLDDGNSSIKVYYDASTNEIAVDARGVDRLINDSGTFDGWYHSTLPQQLAKGETLKLNVFFDHSILDIFVNDRWATSVRVFALGKTNESITAFSESPVQIKSINAWNMRAANGSSAISPVVNRNDNVELSSMSGSLRYNNVPTPSMLSIYNISGTKILERRLSQSSGSIKTAAKGFHIVSIKTDKETKVKKVCF